MTRTRIATLLATLAGLQATLILAPMPLWALWLVHMAALETSVLATLTGAVAAWLALRPARAGSRAAGLAVGVGVLGALVGLLPVVAVLPACAREGVRFSLVAYLTGTRAPDVEVERDVELEPTRSDLLADVTRARGAGPHPFVVLVHGGSWKAGDKGEAPHLTRALAENGITVLDIRYRLAPAYPFPAGLGDVKCVLGRAREQAARLGIDPDRGALLGRSAGGHLALLAAYTAGDPRLPPSCDVVDRPVTAVVALYPVVDLAWGWAEPLRPDLVNARASLEMFLEGTPAARPDRYALASPLTHLDHPVPPTLLLHGTGEHVVRPGHSERLEGALRARGDSVKLIEIPLADHGLDFRPGGPGEQLARGAILRFLAGR